MRDTSGMTCGTLVIEGRFSGMLTGTGVVPAGGEAEITGMICGDLVVEAGARARITGMVMGTVIDRGGAIELAGMAGRVVRD